MSNSEEILKYVSKRIFQNASRDISESHVVFIFDLLLLSMALTTGFKIELRKRYQPVLFYFTYLQLSDKFWLGVEDAGAGARWRCWDGGRFSNGSNKLSVASRWNRQHSTGCRWTKQEATTWWLDTNWLKQLQMRKRQLSGLLDLCHLFAAPTNVIAFYICQVCLLVFSLDRITLHRDYSQYLSQMFMWNW